jgi:hypothetical protein
MGGDTTFQHGAVPDRRIVHLVSRRGWIHLRNTYREAWQVRVETGDSSPDVLIDTFRRATPPAGVPVEGMPGAIVLDLWNRGVEPRRLKRELYMGVGRAAWNATVVPGKAIYDSLRGSR